MGFRYRRSVRVSKRTKLNVGTKQASVSVGSPGLTVNLSRRGVRATVGVPGTGLSYVTKQVGGNRRRGSLLEELFAAIFIVFLLGALRVVGQVLAGIVGLVFHRGAQQDALADRSGTDHAKTGNDEQRP
jgi:Protein of unknown function (DUF4236)